MSLPSLALFSSSPWGSQDWSEGARGASVGVAFGVTAGGDGCPVSVVPSTGAMGSKVSVSNYTEKTERPTLPAATSL